MQQKIILIPGWMAGEEMYQVNYPVLEIWRDKISPENNIDSDWIITHSLGSLYIFSNSQNWKNKKIILASPLILKKSIPIWFFRWINFHLNEKPPRERNFIIGLDQIYFGLKIALKILRLNMPKILASMPKDKIFIVYGAKDRFFFGEESLELAKKLGIRSYEVEAGHYWNDSIAKKADEIIENN